jgi:hypothetical protein
MKTTASVGALAPSLQVIPGGLNLPGLIRVERHRWDELLISRAVAATERLAAAEQERLLLLGALRALAASQPDVDTAERLLTAALRLVVREATRAAADIEPGPEPDQMEVAA